MPAKTTTVSWADAAAAGETGGWRTGLSLALGLAFTVMLFLGIAHFQQVAPERPPAEPEDLRMAILPVQPPPVPVKPAEPAPEVPPMAGFELSHSDSPVQIAVSPPDLKALLPEDLSKAPPANAQVNLRLTDFKPKTDFLQDEQHIYQRGDLDQPVVLLARRNPQVSNRISGDAKMLRVILMGVVDVNGTVNHIRLTKSSGNPEFDAKMIEEFKDWLFSAPMKSGRKVRCLIEQKITVNFRSASPWEL